MQLSTEQLNEITTGSLSVKSLLVILDEWVDETKDEVLDGKLTAEAGRSVISKIKEMVGKLSASEKKAPGVNKFV